MSATTIVNQGELGLKEDITSVVEIDKLRIVVSSKNSLTDCVSNNICELANSGNDIVLFATQNIVQIDDINNCLEISDNYAVTIIKSIWSEKMEVNYLDQGQIDQVVSVINKVRVNNA